MKNILLCISILLLILPINAVLYETASLSNFLLRSEPNCAYDRWISHIAEGIVTPGYNTYAPYDRQLTGFGNYVTPTTAQLDAWGVILDLLMVGELATAQDSVNSANFPYQVVHFSDTDSGRTYYMLREIPDAQYYDDNNTLDEYDDEYGAFAYGWGLYIYNPLGTKPIIVTAPHPADDFPTPAFSLETFQILNAKSLLIAGAGREVKWTNVAPYTNAKSLSDPTRVTSHPFNVAYKKFADEIRGEFNTRELSVQNHTYDWNYHIGYPNTQISAGYNKMCPNLPIRDLSSLKLDLINQGSHIMIPANTVGIHSDVYLNDFYSVNYNIHPFTFDDGENQYPVNDYIDLPAYSQNYQMLYTLTNWNDYDTFEPFFHMEMDELPNNYEQSENTYKWFYGWNEAQQRWDYNNLFVNFNMYFLRWVHDLNSIVDAVFTMNDQLVPPAPTALRVQNHSLNSITLAWNKTDSYDFYSYEILVATEPIGLANYTIFDRGNNALLASPDCESVTVTGLNNANNYFFAIRGKDKNGNYSPNSNEVTTIPAPANIYNLTAHGLNNAVRLWWGVAGQTNNQGFSVYRKAPDSEYALMDSYQTNSALSNPTGNNFEWWDYNVQNGETWTYMVSSTNGGGIEFFHNYPVSAKPMRIHALYLTNATAALADSVFFAENPYASDGQDTYYDITKNNPTGSNYVWNAFWQPYWGNQGTNLSREIKSGYDTNLDVKSWTMRVRSTDLNLPLYITASDTFDRAEKLYLYDSGNGTWHNLLSGPYQFTVPNNNARSMTIYWGNLQPRVVHGSQANRIYQGGNNTTFYWSNQNSFLIDHLDVYIKTATDSLFLAGNLPGTQGSLNYTFPQLMDMQNARLYINCHAVDGLMSTAVSNYSFAIVLAMNMHYSEPGWQTRASIWPTLTIPIQGIFGQGASALMPGDGGAWTEANDFAFGIPYWVHSNDIAFYSSIAAIQPTETTYPLTTGWNFIPNPHLCEYPVKSLRFMVNGTLFRYSEMINQSLISRMVYVYREGGFKEVDTILPYEAFYIKYYGSASLTSEISFYPYFTAQDITPPASNWTFNVQFNGWDKDAISLGANTLATDDYDFVYDLPAAPPKPFLSLRSYITREAPEDTGFWDTRLRSEIRAPLLNLQDDEKTWLFKLSLGSADPVEVLLSDANLPDNYSVRFYLNDQGYTYRETTSFTFIPPSAGTYTGIIKVNNHPVSSEDLVQTPISKLQVYPNPFNPSTTIAFYTPAPQDVSVDIYNLKGQKVRTLHNGQLNSGNHHLVWDGKDKNGGTTGSGVYFALVKSNNYRQTIKMILMK